MKRTAPGKVERVEPVELLCSERNVHTLPAPAVGRRFFACDGPTGFRLMVTANGYRAFYLIYNPRGGGAARAYRIGPATDLSFKEAKTKAESLRGLVAQGRDPFAEEEAVRKQDRLSTVVTLRETINYYVAANRQRLDPKTVEVYEQTRDALPRRFIDTSAEEITPALFREAVRETTHAPVMQNRYLSVLKAVVRFAHAEQKMGRLPALVGMRKPHRETRRDRVLTAEEIRVLWQAVDNVVPSMPRGGRAFAASVRTMLLLGTRLGESSLARWEEFDTDGSAPKSPLIQSGQPMWYLPADHRKGEHGKKRPHWIPLPPLAVSVLRDLRALTGDKPVVFFKAGYSARTYMLGKVLAEMKRLSQPEPWTYHDLRRTCSTWLGELGCPQDLNDLILGHVRKGVIAHYDHSQRLGERAEWLRRWSVKVAELCGISDAKPGEPILHLYQTPGGLPEIKSTHEPEHGCRYIGAFPALEAVRRAEEMTRETLRGGGLIGRTGTGTPPASR